MVARPAQEVVIEQMGLGLSWQQKAEVGGGRRAGKQRGPIAKGVRGAGEMETALWVKGLLHQHEG